MPTEFAIKNKEPVTRNISSNQSSARACFNLISYFFVLSISFKSNPIISAGIRIMYKWIGSIMTCQSNIKLNNRSPVIFTRESIASNSFFGIPLYYIIHEASRKKSSYIIEYSIRLYKGKSGDWE